MQNGHRHGDGVLTFPGEQVFRGRFEQGRPLPGTRGKCLQVFFKNSYIVFFILFSVNKSNIRSCLFRVQSLNFVAQVENSTGKMAPRLILSSKTGSVASLAPDQTRLVGRLVPHATLACSVFSHNDCDFMLYMHIYIFYI